MNDRVVLDASVILAIIAREQGHEKLSPQLLARAVASTVNVSEAHAKLVSRGWTPEEAWEDCTSPIPEMLPFEEEHAKIAGSLVKHTQPLGLSLGDRACLALGISLDAPVYTAEKSWKKLALNVKVRLIR